MVPHMYETEVSLSLSLWDMILVKFFVIMTKKPVIEHSMSKWSTSSQWSAWYFKSRKSITSDMILHPVDGAIRHARKQFGPTKYDT